MNEDELAWVTKDTLTLPYGTLATLHEGQSEVRVKQNIHSHEKRVFKRVSLQGREDGVAFNEVVLLQGIDHPNVATVFDVAEPAGADPALRLVEIIMPYYPMGSVFDAQLKGRRFGSGEARDLIVKALRGLGHLHDEHGILHRDPKPANLFLTDDETVVKIGDFGESVRMNEHGNSVPLVSAQFWTPPESFAGGPYTVASDIYGMGASFREILSGQFPYDDYNREQMAIRLTAGREPVKQKDLLYAAHVPRSLRRVVNKATRRDPSDRYQSAEKMIEQLLLARFVDWGWPQSDCEDVVWLGRWNGADYRVTVTPRKRGSVQRARAESRYPSGWRKISGISDQDAPDAMAAAEAAFAQIEVHLFSD
jgi:serine/threonine protein kinase